MNPSTSSTREAVIKLAREYIEKRPVYFDTETTGLDKNAEVIEISIVDWDGSILFSSFVKPTVSIPADALRVHGITNTMVSAAPAWPVLWPQIRPILFGRLIGAYNAPFDLKMMQQSHARYRIPWKENFAMLDILPLYSDYRSVWDPMRGSMKYFKLEEAGAYFKIPLPNAHRSAADALLTRAVLHCIAGVAY